MKHICFFKYGKFIYHISYRMCESSNVFYLLLVYLLPFDFLIKDLILQIMLSSKKKKMHLRNLLDNKKVICIISFINTPYFLFLRKISLLKYNYMFLTIHFLFNLYFILFNHFFETLMSFFSLFLFCSYISSNFISNYLYSFSYFGIITTFYSIYSHIYIFV